MKVPLNGSFDPWMDHVPPACAPGGFRPGPGYGHGRGSSYYSETTVITTVVACDRCGRSFEPLTPHSFSFNSPLADGN